MMSVWPWTCWATREMLSVGNDQVSKHYADALIVVESELECFVLANSCE